MVDFWRRHLCALPAIVAMLSILGGCERPSVRVEGIHISASSLIGGIEVTQVGSYRTTYGPVKVTIHNDLPKSIDVVAVEVWSKSSTGRGTVELGELKPPLPVKVEARTAVTVEGYISVSYEKTARFLARVTLQDGEIFEGPVAKK